MRMYTKKPTQSQLIAAAVLELVDCLLLEADEDAAAALAAWRDEWKYTLRSIVKRRGSDDATP